MSSLLTASPPAAPVRAGRRRGALWSVPEVRWAAAATLLFLAGLVTHWAGAPEWLWWALYLACYAAGGWEPAREGLRALRNRSLDVDLLMIVAAIGAASIGQVFDGALLIVIFATSGALEAVATRRTEDSVKGLLDLAPERASRVDESGEEQLIEATALVTSDHVIIRPGERVGADGVVVDGDSDVDQSSITGEPLPAAKSVGDEVFAGTLNGTGVLRVRVTRDPSDTVVARIVAMVEEASATKATTQLFIEKIEQRYSITVVAATLALFTIPLAFGAGLQDTLLRAMTFMIVASPCAVVLATMPPLLSTIANAGRHGVLVKSAVVMERLGDTTVVAFDKTGTLTEGTPRVSAVQPLASGEFDTAQLLTLAGAAEQPSEHPLGRAIVAAAHEQHLRLPVAEQFRSLPGRGVQATVAGTRVQVLRPTRDEGECPRTRKLVTEIETAGQTAVVVEADGRPAGVLGLADRIRPDAADTVTALTAMTGTSPVLLTGDNLRAATRLADTVGIGTVRAGLLPEQKVSAVQQLQGESEKVLVVGDGINDAPALAAAHTAMAMGRAGSDLALETADAVIMRDELAAIPAVIALSRRARRIVVANLTIAATFITVLVVWDLVGHLPLPLGVAGHEGSTIIVGLNGLRLLGDRAWRRAQQDER
jgi:heavy metal translocating P-type ATPase